MTVARFVCTAVTKKTGWGGVKFMYGASFSAVSGDTEENKKFFASTPSGSITMDTIREDHFEPGKTYSVTFEEVSG